MTAYILNLLDMAFTLHALEHGARELNQFVNWMIGVHPWLFVFSKVVVAGAALWIMKRVSRTLPFARKVLVFITALYGLVVLWHFINLFAVIAT